MSIIPRDPSAVPILESDIRPPPMHRRGLCLVCGSWLELGGDQDGCSVTLARGEAQVSEHVAHIECLKRVAHPAANMFGSDKQQIGENYLDAKHLDMSGR